MLKVVFTVRVRGNQYERALEIQRLVGKHLCERYAYLNYLNLTEQIVDNKDQSKVVDRKKSLKNQTNEILCFMNQKYHAEHLKIKC